MNEIVKCSKELYHEIDDCITNLIKARFDKDADKENEAISNMESLLVSTMQNLSWMVGELKDSSKIRWQTGTPKESGAYLITTYRGNVFVDYWRVFPNKCDWDYRDKFDVKAWCKISDIEPYKE